MSKVEKNRDNLSKCVCARCPSYNECAIEANELLFCADPLKERVCKYKMNICICDNCPVFKEAKLRARYYCIYGSASEID